MKEQQAPQTIADNLKLRWDGFQSLPFMPAAAVFTRMTDGCTIYMPVDCTQDEVAARYAAKDKERCELCGQVHSVIEVAIFCIGCLSNRVSSPGDICADCHNFAAAHGGN